MEFGERLQQLRKQKGLTQEELAQALYVSRTAVSKWESGRGYPKIDSLRAIAQYFSVTIDALLCGSEALSVAEEETRQREERLCDRVFGLLDCSVASLFFLPLFAQRADGIIREVSLAALSDVAPYMKAAYSAFVLASAALGVATLALQGCSTESWMKGKRAASLALNAAGVLLFIVSPQPYAAAMLFVFLVIKALLLAKKP